MHISKQCAYMIQVTVRQVEEEWVAKAKAVAVEKGVSMNSVQEFDFLGQGENGS